MKPQGFNQPEMALKSLKLDKLVLHCSESCRNAMDWLRLRKMDRNMEIGLEIGSAGPIWIRLLFVWPKPHFNGYALTTKSMPTFQPAGMRLLYIIAAGFCNLCYLTYEFYTL